MMRMQHDQHPHDSPDLIGAGLDANLLRLALRYAVRAPSSHNSQPWLFHVDRTTVELRADRSRRLPIADPDDRELVISCGAALFHLRLAIHRFGYVPNVEVLAEPDRPDLLARVSLGPRLEPTETLVMLTDAIEKRRTNRGQFLPRDVGPQELCALRDAAEKEGGWLYVVPKSKRASLAALIAEGDQRQWHDSAFRCELASWMRSNHTKAADGMPGTSVGLGDLAAKLAPMMIRRFNRGDGVAAHDTELVEGSPVLAVLGVARDRPADWLMAGQALAHVLLLATTLDLAASFLNQPLEMPALRARVHELIEIDGAPQIILRLGFPASFATATPRRTVDDVLR